MLPTFHRTQSLLFGADFKLETSDFQVNEVLGFECSGQGEHVWVQICKTGINTVDAARRLARAAGVDMRAVSWSGLKDKQGVCRQWISLQMPGKDTPDFSTAVSDELQIEQIQRNHRKLRRGSHRSNEFVIRLRNLRWLEPLKQSSELPQMLTQQLERIRSEGVPNYFGEQRFGADNINKVTAWFEQHYRPRNPVEKGLLLSSARSLIFNEVLSERVKAGNWNKYLLGDVLNLNGTASVFVPEEFDAALQQRLAEMDVHPTGPLWGRGDSRVAAEVLALETRVGAGYSVLTEGLCRHAVESARRSLRLPVQALHYRLSESLSDLELSFSLPAGSFATAVLHELIEYNTL